MVAQLVWEIKRAEPSRATIDTSQASYRVTSFSSSFIFMVGFLIKTKVYEQYGITIMTPKFLAYIKNCQNFVAHIRIGRN
jgi:hypothetical protein